MSIPDEAAYLDARPKLKAAVEALDAAMPDLERLWLAAEQAQQMARMAFHDGMAAVRAIRLRYGVADGVKYDDMPQAAKDEAAAAWAESNKRHDAERAAKDAYHAALKPLEAAFEAAGDEDADATCGWRWGRCYQWNTADMREAVRNLALKAHMRQMREAFYARPRMDIADVRVGMILFLPHPNSELRRVVKVTPTGMVDAQSLHNGGIVRFRQKHWPEARRVTRAMAREALELAAEWKRRFPQPEKESVA